MGYRVFDCHAVVAQLWLHMECEGGDKLVWGATCQAHSWSARQVGSKMAPAVTTSCASCQAVVAQGVLGASNCTVCFCIVSRRLVAFVSGCWMVAVKGSSWQCALGQCSSACSLLQGF